MYGTQGIAVHLLLPPAFIILLIGDWSAGLPHTSCYHKVHCPLQLCHTGWEPSVFATATEMIAERPPKYVF
jgi:hypothetical protein